MKPAQWWHVSDPRFVNAHEVYGSKRVVQDYARKASECGYAEVSDGGKMVCAYSHGRRA